MDDTIGARKMTFRALFVPEKKILIEYRYRSDTAYRCTKITKVSGKIVEIDHYETHPEHRVASHDIHNLNQSFKMIEPPPPQTRGVTTS